MIIGKLLWALMGWITVTNTFKEIFPDTDISCYKIEDEPNIENNEAKNCNKKVSVIRAKKRKVLHRVNYNYHILS